jgi:hypothetical protein
MKRLILSILIILLSLAGFSQPADGTYGNVAFNSRAHAWFRATGWSISDPNSHILVWFNGDGSNTSTFSTYANESPSTILNAGQWNGITNLPTGGTAKWLIFVMGNMGTTTQAETDIAYFFQTLLGNAYDTTNGKTRLHIGGFSGGPGRMWAYLRNWAGVTSPYRGLFSTTISISCASIFDDLNPVAVGKRHYVWYGDPAGDGNSGTPPSTSLFIYNNGMSLVPANTEKRFRYTIGGTHGNSTVGIYNDPLTCLAVTGTDTITNRYLWMIYAYSSPGTNVGPTANAGPDQVVVLPTSFGTLNGTGSTDPDGSISTYAWTKISGPTGGTITSPAGSTTTVTSLIQGVYSYRLVVTDNGGLSDDDTVLVTVTNGVASSNLLTIDTRTYFWPWTGQERPELLFDGLLDKKMDEDGFTTFSAPMKFIVELKDSVYENLKLRFWNGFGQTQQWDIDFCDSNRASKGHYTFTGASLPFMGWYTMYGIPDTITTPIRYVMFNCTSAQTDVREIEIYGDRVVKASTIIPTTITPTILTDPGRLHIGGSSLGGKDTLYMQLASGLALYPAFRAPTNMFVWNHDETKPYATQDIEMDKFGDMDKSGLRFFKRKGAEVMLYVNGASLSGGSRPDLTSSSGYNALTGLNNFKDILKGTDSTLVASWTNSARTYKALTALWGRNTTPNTSGYNIFGTNSPDLTRGQNKVRVVEMENEPDKTWLGVTGYHSPEVLWAKYKRIYDSVKNADPTMLAYSGALLSADSAKLKAIHIINYWYTGSKTSDPFDGICFNQYISNTYGGQPQGGTASAVSPEQFQVKERMIAYGKLRDRIFPGKGFRWTEIGYTANESDYNVVEVPGIPDSIGAASFMIRTQERAFMVPNVLERMYNYFHTSDGSGVFNGMKMVVELFDPTFGNYIGSRRLPIWFMYATRVNALNDYKGYSTIVTDGDSTSINVVYRDHVSDVTKRVYSVWLGSYSGATQSNYVLNVGGATTATLVTFQHNNETGIQTNLPITSNTVTIPQVNEIVQYVVISTSIITPPVNKISKPNGVRWNIIQ